MAGRVIDTQVGLCLHYCAAMPGPVAADCQHLAQEIARHQRRVAGVEAPPQDRRLRRYVEEYVLAKYVLGSGGSTGRNTNSVMFCNLLTWLATIELFTWSWDDTVTVA